MKRIKEIRNVPWVFYDGDCSVCRRAVWVVGRVLGRRNVAFVKLQENWVGKLFALKRDIGLEEMKLLTVDRRRLGGADAILYLMGRVWWLRPLAAFLRLPPLIGCTCATYLWVARHRYCFTGRCAINPGPTGKRAMG